MYSPTNNDNNNNKRLKVAVAGSTTLSENIRRLVEPDNNDMIPWSVDVISMIPKLIINKQRQHHYTTKFITSAACGKWKAICIAHQQTTSTSTSTTNNNTTAISIAVWYTPSNTSLQQQEDTNNYIYLQHPEFNTTSSSSTAEQQQQSLIVKLQTSSTDDVVFLYALNPVTGKLLLYQITCQQITNSSSTGSQNVQQQQQQRDYNNNIRPSVICTLWKAQDGTDGSSSTSNRIATAMTVVGSTRTTQIIIIGTSDCKIYYITQVSVPISLLVQPVHHTSSAGRSGFLGRFLGRFWNTVQYHEPDTPIAAIASTPSTNNIFVSCCETGKLVFWNQYKYNTYEITQEISLLQQFNIALLENNTETTTTNTLQDLTILHAVFAKSNASSNEEEHNSNEDDDGSSPGSSTILHLLCLTRHNDGQQQENRLYWICIAPFQNDTESMKIIHYVWLNRFVAPEKLDIIGLCVSSNGNVVYTAISNVMIALDSNLHYYEVDIPEVTSLLYNSFTSDIVTHGVTVLDENGKCFRTRLVTSTTTTTISRSNTTTTSTAQVPMLTNHLRSTFRSCYARAADTDDCSVTIPPSLQNATIIDLECTVMNVANEIQNSKESPNPEETYSGYINFLKNIGLYREFSSTCKWKLLSIGQEISVYMALNRSSNIQPKSNWEEQWLSTSKLVPSKIGKWMQDVQTDVLQDGSNIDHYTSWQNWLDTILNTAVIFREDQDSKYDVLIKQVPRSDSSESVPIWTSSPIVQNVLMNQIEYWHSHTLPNTLPTEYVDRVIRVAVLSCGEGYKSYPSPEMKDRYVNVLQKSFRIVRVARVWDGDAFLFEIFKEHNFFRGLCKLVFDHEIRSDKDYYAMIPLIKELEHCEDIETGSKFPMYALTWYTDRKAYGRVMQYGTAACPNELNTLLINRDELATYRWMYAISIGDYDAAADSLLQNSHRTDATVGDAHFALCNAGIVNTIVQHESYTKQELATQRHILIEKRKELINSHYEILGTECKKELVWSSRTLLNRTVKGSMSAKEKEVRIRFMVIALAICTTFEEDRDCQDSALMVWMQAITADRDMWLNWQRNEPDLTDSRLRDTVLQKTLFGALLQQCEEMDGWNVVSYPALEDKIFTHLENMEPTLGTDAMKRLLRSVTSEDHELSRGIVVGSDDDAMDMS